ncbi:MAG: hypothetical protein QOF41_2544 [Methylobacteriaceae bacterium]|nr:hypothetical protein [Methylobacteriaceae bacterium]
MRRASKHARSPTSLIGQELRTIYVPQIGLPFEIDAALRAIELLAPAPAPVPAPEKRVA